MFKKIENPAACEMRSVIRFLNAKNMTPAEIHRQLCDVYGEHAMSSSMVRRWVRLFNLLTPNVNYSGRTAPLTSKVAFYIFIQQIYLLNILNMVYTLRFFSSKCSLFHNSNVFGSYIIHILYTGCAKIKKIIPAPKG